MSCTHLTCMPINFSDRSERELLIPPSSPRHPWVQVQARVPAGSIQTAGAAFSLLDESVGCTDLSIVVRSDFQEASLPLRVHGGASWLVSDLAILRSRAMSRMGSRIL